MLLLDIEKKKAVAETFRRRSGKTNFPIFLKGFCPTWSLSYYWYCRQFMTTMKAVA